MYSRLLASMMILLTQLALQPVTFAADTRNLTVTIEVRNPDEQPIAGSELLVRSGLNPEQQFKCGETNAAGVASIILPVDEDESRVFLVFSAGGDPDVSGAVRTARRERFWELLSQYALLGWTQHPIA